MSVEESLQKIIITSVDKTIPPWDSKQIYIECICIGTFFKHHDKYFLVSNYHSIGSSIDIKIICEYENDEQEIIKIQGIQYDIPEIDIAIIELDNDTINK